MLLHADTFNHYLDADKASGIYTSYVAGYGTSGNTVTAALGARGGGVLKLHADGGSQWTGALSHSVSASGNVCGFAGRYKFVTPFSSIEAWTDPEGAFFSDIKRAVLFTCRKSNANLWWVRPQQSGKLAVFRGSTQIAESSIALTQNVFTYVEVQVKISTTVGYVKMRFDEVEVCNETGLNTSATGDDSWDEYRIGQIGATAAAPTGLNIYLHDWSVYDGSGTEWYDFMGDIEWDDYRVTANGNYSQFTPSAGTNYQNVDDSTADSDSTYNRSSTVGHKDSFAVTDVDTGDAIKAVLVRAQCRKESGSAGIKLGFRIGGSDYTGSEQSVSSSHAFKTEIFITNPATSEADWTAAALNAAEVLYEKAS